MNHQNLIFRWIRKLSPVQILLFFYLIAVLSSTGIMALPVAYQEGVDVAFIDVLFTSVSALSVTGLSTITIADTLSTTGIILLACILQLGAVGVMSIGTFIWLLLGKKIGLKERRLIMTDQNQTSFEGMVRLIKQIVYVLLVIELVGFLILGTYFLQYFPTAKEAYLHGFFGTISAVSNGGFDITGQSLVPFKDDYFIQFINMLLIIFGAIGFPVLIEVKEYIFAKYENRKLMRFSLFTKLTTVTFLILIILGALFIFLLDIGNFFAGKSWHEALFYSLFQSVTTRSGGLSTMDVSQLTEGNQLFMSMLMFIGASPSSAGGGIRTTTFALVVIFIITYARGGGNIRIFGREIYDEDLFKAVTVTLMAIVFVFSSVLVMSIIEPFSLSEILFEATSAFGTVGLSLGITDEISTFSKIILMILMFIGRIGIITFLFIFKNNRKSGKYHYPKEKIIIG
ncbi:Ktr system potassium uptake protein D [Virgibacillus profundi]|uniref:Ktr system potassium uptake protein D n=1 Tax=Virgibacillus profundi TaxID=2024555 RepID=A0A2A2ICB9_9BACI|nr:TrkH family potassium uptake protein [Virgibacillus profundi]PAV28795.1 Ktr system potassium uptake protein D [Virgibacillus profundi]PXY52963.1 TrkH family potassium uptake protein [Virgibacillus profundi]